MKNMNNNLIHLDNVSAEGKNRIIMYTTARQFKNAVPIEEMMDSLDFMFLDELCNYLDAKAKELILKKYNYDVNKDIR